MGVSNAYGVWKFVWGFQMHEVIQKGLLYIERYKYYSIKVWLNLREMYKILTKEATFNREICNYVLTGKHLCGWMLTSTTLLIKRTISIASDIVEVLTSSPSRKANASIAGVQCAPLYFLSATIFVLRIFDQLATTLSLFYEISKKVNGFHSLKEG